MKKYKPYMKYCYHAPATVCFALKFEIREVIYLYLSVRLKLYYSRLNIHTAFSAVE